MLFRSFDLPTKAGLASSSAYTVGLLRACTTLDKHSIAKLATTWEQDKMNGNVGSQDQYLCAVGGFHLLHFNEHGIRDCPIECEALTELQDWLMLFDTHQYRRASDVVQDQLAQMKKHRSKYEELAKMPQLGLQYLHARQWDLFGTLLADAWTLKRSLAKTISTPEVDDIYQTARHAGAIGGKLLGGGGGGFIVFVVDPLRQDAVRQALNTLTYVPFRFEKEGSVVVYRDER